MPQTASPAPHSTLLSPQTVAAMGGIARTFPEHIPFYIAALVFGAATFVTVSLSPVPIPFGAISATPIVFTFFLLFCLAAIGAFSAIRLVLPRRPGSPRNTGVASDRLGNAVHTLIPVFALFICFYALKDEIPALHPFAWDATLASWDRVLGFGWTPWEWLQPFVGWPVAISALSALYEAWFPVILGCFAWQAFSAVGTRLRMQYLLASVLCWFGAGIAIATVFSSGGPCYYGHLVSGPNPYAGQLAYLRAANAHWPVWSIALQRELWSAYETGQGAVSGVSAFPSMHVTLAALTAIVCWRANRPLGAAAIVYAILTFIGSIALAWHYAVDGIAGAALAVAFWIAAGRIAAWWEGVLARWRARAPASPAASAPAPSAEPALQ